MMVSDEVPATSEDIPLIGNSYAGADFNKIPLRQVLHRTVLPHFHCRIHDHAHAGISDEGQCGYTDEPAHEVHPLREDRQKSFILLAFRGADSAQAELRPVAEL